MPNDSKKRRLRTGKNNSSTSNNHHRPVVVVQPHTFPAVKNNDYNSNSNNNNNEVIMIQLVPLPQAGQQQQQQSQQLPPLTQTAQFLQTATSPFATAATAFEYSAVLCLTLATWLVYLLLPKGVRKAYCRANRRRYPRQVSSTTRRVAAAWDPRNVSLNTNSSSYYAGSSHVTTPSEYYNSSNNGNSEYNTVSYNPSEEDQIILDDDETLTTTTDDKDSFVSVQDSVLHGHVRQQRQQQSRMTRQNASYLRAQNTPAAPQREQARDDDEDKDPFVQRQPFPSSFSPQRRSIFAQGPTTAATTSFSSNNKFGWSAKASGDVAEQFASFFPNNSNSNSRTPSLSHPAIMHLPDTSILQETMRRFTDRGVRLMAHGVTCAPKRVWIRLDLQDPTARNLEWQTEVPRSITNQSGATSIVLMRGAKHVIPLPNILYVDVGKKTSALQKADNKHIPATACFSLLTQTGSLDLQTNSKLERDAVVSCLSMVLDYVHPEHDWRMLYEQTPPASIATTGASSGGGGGGALSNISSSVFPQATTVDI